MFVVGWCVGNCCCSATCPSPGLLRWFGFHCAWWPFEFTTAFSVKPAQRSPWGRSSGSSGWAGEGAVGGDGGDREQTQCGVARSWFELWWDSRGNAFDPRTSKFWVGRWDALFAIARLLNSGTDAHTRAGPNVQLHEASVSEELHLEVLLYVVVLCIFCKHSIFPTRSPVVFVQSRSKLLSAPWNR